MTATYELSNDVGKVRFLTGDTDISAPKLSDEEIGAAIAMELGAVGATQSAPDLLILAAADCLESQASKLGATRGSVKIGGYQSSSSDRVKALQAAATTLRDRVNNTPAFAIADQNLSVFNQMDIIRNWILKTVGGGYL